MKMNEVVHDNIKRLVLDHHKQDEYIKMSKWYFEQVCESIAIHANLAGFEEAMEWRSKQ